MTSNRFDVILFEKHFDDKSKKFRKNKSQIINKRNQKISLVKEVKKEIADLIKNKTEQIKKILLKIIEMLKVDRKENVENSSKLVRTLNRIENKFQIIEKQNANSSTKAKTYASVVKAATKMTRIENEKKNAMKKMITTNMITTKKKEIDDENRKRNRKKRIAKHNKCRTFEKN